jgi:hypothetical protein
VGQAKALVLAQELLCVVVQQAAAALDLLLDFVRLESVWWPFFIPMPYLPNFLTT